MAGQQYYDEDGAGCISWTADAIAPGGRTVDELRQELERMLSCLDADVMEYS